MTERAVTITFHGPIAEAGPLDVGVVLPVVEAFGDALRLMIRHHHAEVTGNRPPYPALLSASALRLAGVSADPGAVTLAIAPPQSLGKLADAPLDGLKALLSGIVNDIGNLPTEVAFPLRQIAAGLPDGINAVVITAGDGLPAVTLKRELFDEGPPQIETLRYHGRLWEVNWRRGTAVLGSPLGTCLLVFPKTMAEAMRSVAGRLVSVAGKGEYTPDGLAVIRKIEAISAQPEDDGKMTVGLFDVVEPFEKDVQQALAVIRWEEKQREWFYDDELDAFVDAILSRKYKDPC